MSECCTRLPVDYPNDRLMAVVNIRRLYYQPSHRCSEHLMDMFVVGVALAEVIHRYNDSYYRDMPTTMMAILYANITKDDPSREHYTFEEEHRNGV